MTRPAFWALAGLSAVVVGLGVRRVAADARASRAEADLAAGEGRADRFSDVHLEGLPEPARRYLRHAIAPGTPLAPAVRLWMEGEMRPTAGAPPTALTASETLAPRRGFVWTARARMKGVPVRVRDQYVRNEGGVRVVALGVVPVPLGSGPDVTRSARGRLMGEGVWCPTALVHPDVAWESAGPHRARYTVTVDGEPVSVTLTVGPDGELREVTLRRWGNPDGGQARLHPYGFRVEAEQSFGGVTIPTRVRGGWQYGTERYDPAGAASFTVHRAEFVAC